MYKYAAKLASTIILVLTFACSLSLQASSLITYYHNNSLGSPIIATDEHGNVLFHERYLPYGERQEKNTASNDNRLWYIGKPADEETGLSYFNARYYDPVLGRFLSPDPVSYYEDNIHSFNRYSYANNNPYRYIDPDGEDAHTLGVSGRVPIAGVGLGFGFFVTGLPPETTPEPFDLGVYGSATPGWVGTAYKYLFGDDSTPEFSKGIDFGKLTVDAGVQWAGRNALNGPGADIFGGYGAWGGSVNFDAGPGGNNNPNLPSSDFPTGVTIEYGPQMRAGAELNYGQSVSIGDIFVEIWSSIDWATDGWISGVR